MKVEKEKVKLTELQAAWRRQNAKGTPLSEGWLKAAVHRAMIKEPEEEGNSWQLWLGLALSAAVSMAIFVSGNFLYPARQYTQPVYVYLENGSYLSFLIGEQR